MRFRMLLTGAAASAFTLAAPAAAFAGTSGGHDGGYNPRPLPTPSQQCEPSHGWQPQVQQDHQQGCCQQHGSMGDNDRNSWQQQGNSCTCTPSWVLFLDPHGHGQWDKNGKYDPRHGKWDHQQQACGCPKSRDNDRSRHQKGCTVTTGYPGDQGGSQGPCKTPTVTDWHNHGNHHFVLS